MKYNVKEIEFDLDDFYDREEYPISVDEEICHLLNMIPEYEVYMEID